MLYTTFAPAHGPRADPHIEDRWKNGVNSGNNITVGTDRQTLLFEHQGSSRSEETTGQCEFPSRQYLTPGLYGTPRTRIDGIITLFDNCRLSLLANCDNRQLPQKRH